MEAKAKETGARTRRQGLRRGGLARMLLLAFLPLILGLFLVIGVAGAIVGVQVTEDRVFNQLELVSSLKEGEITRWVRERDRDMAVLTSEPQLQREAAILMAEAATNQARFAAYSKLGIRLNEFLEAKVSFAELFLLDAESGETVVSTDILQEGANHAGTEYFESGLQGSYLQPPRFEERLRVPTLILARPLTNEGRVVAVLVGRVNLSDLSVLMLQRTGLGETGETYLVDRDMRAITDLRFGQQVQQVDTVGARQALVRQQEGNGRYENYQGAPVFGVYRWIPDLEVALLAEESEDEALAATRFVLWGVLALTLGGGALAAATVVWVSRRITQPITRLTEAATEMAAGDLSQRVAVERRDEIGALSQAFDDMADQVDELVSTLEERVADRTRALEQRAVQLATAADVGRAAASILDLETLAHQVVDLIRRRFSFYYTGLFLVDDAGRYAVLEAGTGEPGRIMKEQGHKLRVGGVSMVGAACAQHEARIALDVGAEAVRFDNPLLPGTRSEMALPLVVGDRVLGALDVQSTEPAAFSDEDLAVLQLVADQVAVAVDNAHKFSEEATLLEAANPLFRVSRRLAAANTTGEIVQAILSSVAETEADGCAVALFGPAEGQDGKADTVTFLGAWHRWREPGVPLGVPLPVEEANFPPSLATSFWTVEDVSEDERISEARRRALVENEVWAVVNVPLRLGDSVIGFVDVQRATAGPFSPVSVRLYETLTDQAAVALERGRLLEESQRRAEHEQMLSQMTARFTRSLDIDTLLQAAARELGQLPDVAEASVYIGIPGGAPPANGDEMEQNE